GGRHVEEPAVEVQCLVGIQELVKVGFLGQVADALVLVDLDRRLAEHIGVAFGWKEQSQQELDGRRFAGPVRPEKTEDLTLIDLQVEGPQGGLFPASPKVAVDLGQIAGFNNNVTAHNGLTRPWRSDFAAAGLYLLRCVSRERSRIA